ncbi:MAG: Eco57I restriction-modification methylase domain-containing protein [Brevinema sp.]
MQLKLSSLNDFLKKRDLLDNRLDNDKLSFFINELTKYREDLKNIVDTASEDTLRPHLDKLLSSFDHFKVKTNYDKMDLSLWVDDRLKVIIEAKTKTNKTEMITDDDINKKAFYETIYYFLEQQAKQQAIHSVIITDYHELYLIERVEFQKITSPRSAIQNAYKEAQHQSASKNTFYETMKSITNDAVIEAIKIDLLHDDEDLLYRLFDRPNIMHEAPKIDPNSLNRQFYNELLYIMGLEEEKKTNKLVKNSVSNTLLDLTMQNINIGKESFETALGLNILWLNRILFLKILEAQLRVFWNDKDFALLDPKQINDYSRLSKLFFKILSIPIPARHPDDKQYKTVPYLNSSLFEETELEQKRSYGISDLDKDRKILLPKDSVLYQAPNFKDLELPLLEYLLRFLECYQFNSESNDIDDHTVIKSSVLGLVFEKLNGYQEGSHFTPASITMYMAQEVIQKRVLAQFNKEFAIDCQDFQDLQSFVHRNCYKQADRQKAVAIIDHISILDPAVGSGHFLVSCLNELIRIKSDFRLLHDDINIDIQNDELIIKYHNGEDFVYQVKDAKINPEVQKIQQHIFHTKKHIIENQLYGIDINPNSVNICRLRLWIELLKHTYFTNDHYIDLEVLPNLEFKIMTANSLIALKKESSSLVSSEYEPLKERLNLLFKDYYTAQLSDKNQIRLHITETLKDMKNLTTFSSDGKDQIEQLQAFSPFNTTVTAPFFDSEFMFGVGQFDIVIANPPYFALQSIPKKNNPYQGKNFDTYAPTGDIYQLFIERAFGLIHEEGQVSMIVSNKWMRAGYGEGTREWLYKHAYVWELLDLGSNWFDSATVDTNIISYQKRQGRPHQASIPSYTLNNKIQSIKIGKIESEQKYIIPTVQGEAWIILNDSEAKILDKMHRVGKPLKDWDIEIKYGIKTGFNEAFIIDGATKDQLIAEDPKSAEIIKPILRGRDIKRYSYEFADQWLIGTLPALRVNINEYPVIKRYLESFRPRIDQSGENGSRKKTTSQWFETQDTIAYYQDFDKPKIVWGEIVQQAKFTYDNTHTYLEATTFLIVGSQLHYLTGILNSKFGEFGFKNFFAGGGLGNTGFRYKKAFLERVPIPVPSPAIEQQITALVQTILDHKARNIDTTPEEKQIDQIVYKLYELTEDEIQTIEANSHSQDHASNEQASNEQASDKQQEDDE